MGVSQAFKLILNALKAAWDHAAALVILNMAWFCLILAPMFLDALIKGPTVMNLICTGVSILLFGPVSAATHCMIARILSDGEVSVREFFEALKRFFWRSELLFIGWLVVLLVLAWAFTGSGIQDTILMRIVNGICLYLVLVWFLVFQYLFPFLVQQDINVRLVLKRSTILMFDNLLVSLMLLLLSGVLTFAAIMLVIPMVILWFTVIGLMQNYVTVELLKKYSNGHSHELN